MPDSSETKEIPSKIIAVVDAEKTIPELLAENLTVLGYKVVQADLARFVDGAEDPIDPDAFLRENDPRMIFWDIPVPKQIARELYRKIRNSAYAEGRTFVVMSTNPRERQELKETRPCKFLTKPFDIEDVIRIVDNEFNAEKNAEVKTEGEMHRGRGKERL